MSVCAIITRVTAYAIPLCICGFLTCFIGKIGINKCATFPVLSSHTAQARRQVWQAVLPGVYTYCLSYAVNAGARRPGHLADCVGPDTDGFLDRARMWQVSVLNPLA